MPRKRKKPDNWWTRLDPQRQRRLAWVGVNVLAVIAVITPGAIYLGRLEDRLLAKPEFASAPRIKLVGVPEDIRDEVMTAVEPTCTTSWVAPDLCKRLAVALAGNPWVRQVKKVRKYYGGQIAIDCTYRRPVAWIQQDGVFYAVDSDLVRLPGSYGYGPGLMLVQGVSSPVPAAGKVWRGADTSAGVELADILSRQEFCGQILGILVHNFGGREAPRAKHIELATDQPGGRIIWGSAPGYEIEENSVDQKLRILLQNYKNTGRIDANHQVIDVSTYPDRYAIPG